MCGGGGLEGGREGARRVQASGASEKSGGGERGGAADAAGREGPARGHPGRRASVPVVVLGRRSEAAMLEVTVRPFD